VQYRDTYIESETASTEDEDQDVTTATTADSSRIAPPALISRNVSSILPHPMQRTSSCLSSPPPSADDLSTFNWYHYFLFSSRAPNTTTL